MSIEKTLAERSGASCELCGAKDNLDAFVVAPKSGDSVDDCVWACATCRTQLLDPEKVDPNHWRCLNDSMWSTVPAVQVVAWRMLDFLRPQGWSGDLIDMLYLDDATLAWAQTELDEKEEATVHKDAFGAILQAGDTVILTQSLDVKGANFTAKRGTAVRNITLVHDNAEQIEGRVEGQKIVILTKFVRKSA
jgi:protein PhnA